MVTNLTPSMANEEVHFVVAGDCFTKWVQMCPLKIKDAATLANWLWLPVLANPSGCG